MVGDLPFSWLVLLGPVSPFFLSRWLMSHAFGVQDGSSSRIKEPIKVFCLRVCFFLDPCNSLNRELTNHHLGRSPIVEDGVRVQVLCMCFNVPLFSVCLFTCSFVCFHCSGLFDLDAGNDSQRPVAPNVAWKPLVFQLTWNQQQEQYIRKVSMVMALF